MMIRAYEGYSQPMGSDLLSMLKTESEKFLSTLTQPVQQQIVQALPQPVAPAVQPEPVIQARAMPAAPAAPSDALPPIAILVLIYLAWQFLGKK